MLTYSAYKGVKLQMSKRFAVLIIATVVILSVGIFGLMYVYNRELGPVSDSQTRQIFSVATGSSVTDIADNLAKQKLIRSAWAMQIYVHTQVLAGKMQAGTYAFAPSQSTPDIVKTLSQGAVATKLVTILPGRRIDQVRADLINSGFSPASVDSALQPDQYKDLPIMTIKPADANLEGLLWPDSYQKTLDSKPALIIRESLIEMEQHLTPDVKSAFAREGLTPYQGLTLASIIVQEVNRPSDQVQVAQVFLSRLKAGMVLGSDVTAYYGAVAAGLAPSLSYDSPYNTLIHTGLPPTPISTVTANGLQAATHPAPTNWLYFVAGDNGTTYFSTNLKDHQALTAQYCHKLCSQ